MQKEPKPSARKSVLIVEDSVDFSNLLKYIVEDDGYEGVQFPIDGDDIVAWAEKYKPVLILMDLALRRKDGMEYIDDLKADPATKKINIIVITGRDLSHKEIIALQLRDVKYLRKGRVEIDEIRNEIRKSLQGKGKAPPEKPHGD